MDTLSLPPIMSAEELNNRAAKFASIMVDQLTKFNKNNPQPKMSDEDWERMRKEVGDKEIRPLPEDFQPTFEAVFCAYMASRYVIVP